MPDTLEQLELSDFVDLVNETFVFSLEGVEQKVEGVLIKAEPIKSGGMPGGGREPFVLDFRFPAGANIGQCVFQVETAKGRQLPPMFLVPRGSDDDGWYMDSSFA